MYNKISKTMRKIIVPLICSILVLSATQIAAQGFTGYYDPANWTIELPDAQYGGSVPAFDANTLVIIGPDGQSCSGEEVRVFIEVEESGGIFFNWEFVNFDSPGWDFFIVRQALNGDVNVLTQVTQPGSGSFVGFFNAGDVLHFVVYSEDCVFGEGVVTITNFDPYSEYTAIPLSSWALYLGILLMISFVVIRFRRLI
jgi:hypothetical protein